MTRRIALAVREVLLAFAPIFALARSGWTQAASSAPSPMGPSPAESVPTGGGEVVAILAILAVGIVGIVIMVRAVDRWHRRDAEAIRLQVELGEVLMRDARMALCSLTVTARVPYWRGSPAVVEVHGDVPTPELRDTVVGLLARELSRLNLSGRVNDRVTVLPRLMHRPA